MEFREIDHQQRVLETLGSYLDELARQKVKAEKIERANAKEKDPDLKRPPLNFPKETWKVLKNLLPQSRREIDYSDRPDGIKRPVPNIVYKVPTAGGKTFLAVNSLSMIFRKYLDQNTGFVLWIVPNEAIYTQTKKHLTNRSHPYRQLLDNLSGNAVRIMEKTNTLNAEDVEKNLCVMLLMLQSANYHNKETLKIFQERGDVHGFTPEEGNQRAHIAAKEAVPNLDTCDLADTAYPWLPIKDSLGNALRIIRPVVVMDEGHKAVSDLAFDTLYGFNPSFVLELTATPKDVKERGGRNPRPARYQNLLVEVSGVELDQAGMIKMPINLDSRQVTDWKATLAVGLEQLNSLQQQAVDFGANHNRYIRPIMLVQVERTGDDQRDGEHVHSEDVKEWLTSAGQLDEAEVAIKTSARNDLSQPENQDLFSSANRVRVIITKQALQEGWDCSFAYVLCSLAASSNHSAMTQLMGRILRQPEAKKTGILALDECYVVTHHAETNKVVAAIKEGLEKDGMGDLVQAISVEETGVGKTVRELQRRHKFAGERIFLPKVLYVTENGKRELDYEEDVLYALDWDNLDIAKLVKKIPDNYQVAKRQLRRIWLENKDPIRDQTVHSLAENEAFDFVYATHLIADIINNAWQAREVVGRVVAGLRKRGFSESKLGAYSSLINEELREWLKKQRDGKAEEHFRHKVRRGQIQFSLQVAHNDRKLNWQMPKTMPTAQPENARQLPRKDGSPMQSSLFKPVYEDDMNKEEQQIAVYMDDVEALRWWHRNVAARRHYYLQGWRRHRIYPDFICSIRADASGNSKLYVLEMKGEHLAGNEDTEYKRAVLKLMTESFDVEQVDHVGEMDLHVSDGTNVRCDLVFLSEYKTKLPSILNRQPYRIRNMWRRCLLP